MEIPGFEPWSQFPQSLLENVRDPRFGTLKCHIHLLIRKLTNFTRI